MKLFSRKPAPVVCRQAVEAVTAYLEGAMSPAERTRFETHLAACPHCTAYVEQIRETIALTGSIEPDALSSEAQDALVGVFQAWSADGGS
ncbi:MAG: anti-sigma factor [Solirubrobacteraceae bacterium]|nr:anti-sigma factor [Solirubrobacteraceae bacterium]